MPIIYSLVARGTAVLAEYSNAKGNFVQISHMILSKVVETGATGRKIYSYDSCFFYFFLDNDLVYLCLTDNEVKAGTAFAFLEDIKGRFLAAYHSRYQTAPAYSFNEDFSRTLAVQMNYFSSPAVDKTAMIKMKIEETKDTMIQNIERLIERSAKIELLVEKTAELDSQAITFKNSAVKLKRRMWWKNVKFWIIISIIALVLIWLIMSLICGFDFKCFRKSSEDTNPPPE